MPPALGHDGSGPVGLVLGALVILAAGVLGRNQWRDHRRRPTDLSPDDASHFERQDLRRFLGTVILAVLGICLAVGGWIPERANGHANAAFIDLWVGVSFLILVLLALALSDWLATRLYARRHRQGLAEEGLALVRDEIRARAALRRRRDRDADADGSGYPL